MTEKKKPKRIRYKRRLLIYSALLFMIVFSITDYICETDGVPDFARKMVKEELKASGLEIKFDDLKCGVVNGIILTNTRMKDSKLGIDNFFTAEKLRASLRFSTRNSFFLAFSTFQVKNGTMKIPLFPEFGDEGKADIVKIENINARILLTGKDINISYFSGRLNPFKMQAYGSLKNILLPIIPKIPSVSKISFSLAPVIRHIPYQTRAKIYRELLKLREEHIFSDPPECQVAFNIDALDTRETNIKVNFDFNSFKYAGFSIKKADTHLVYQGTKLRIDSMLVKLKNKGQLNFSGDWNNETDRITGKITGTLTPEEMDDFLKLAAVNVPPSVKITAPLSFELHFQDYALNAHQTTGTLNVEIPKIVLKRVKIYNFKSRLAFNRNTISAKDFYFETDINKIRGNFEYNSDEEYVNASIQTSGPPIFISQLLGKEKTALMSDILARFKFPKKNDELEISAEIHSSWKDKFFYYITGNMVLHSFKYLNVPFDSGDAKVIIDSNNLLIIPMMTLIRGNSLATVKMVYDNSQNMKYHVESPSFKSEHGTYNRFMANMQCTFPGKDVLDCIFPQWKSEVLDLSFPANIEGGGIIDFSDKDIDLTNFKVNIVDSKCKWYGIPIQHVDCSLIFKEDDMEIQDASGKVYNGKLSLYYKTNLHTEKGRVWMYLDGADFADVAKHIDWDIKDKGGKISVTTNADFEYDDQDNMLLKGEGKVKVRGANLWEVPILKSFGQLSSKWIGNKWGVISDLDADFLYKGDHIYSDNIHTNGSVIALRSKGKYYWTTGDFNFIIHAEVLKSVLPYKIFSKIFDPLSGLMERRIIRKNGDVKWENVKWGEHNFKEEQNHSKP